jgi:hypothetical protein
VRPLFEGRCGLLDTTKLVRRPLSIQSARANTVSSELLFIIIGTLHKASEANSLFLNPSFSKVLTKICCEAFSCGAMFANTKALTLVHRWDWRKRKEGLEE